MPQGLKGQRCRQAAPGAPTGHFQLIAPVLARRRRARTIAYQKAGYNPNRGTAMRLKANEIVVKQAAAFEALLLCGEAPTGPCARELLDQRPPCPSPAGRRTYPGGALERFSSFFWFSIQIVWIASVGSPFSYRLWMTMRMAS